MPPAGVNAAGRQLVALLQNGGHPYASMDDMTVVVDHDAEKVDVHFRLNPGRTAVFGAWSVKGLKTVSRRFFDQRVTWKQGDPYRRDMVDAFGRRLITSGLFSSNGSAAR